MSKSTSTLTQIRANIGQDVLASVVVFLLALPLCMGIAIASGLPPTAGLITGIIGGVVVGALAGAPLQVSGPAAGLTVLVWQLVQQFGVEMLGIIVLLAGLMQVLAGTLKLGQWFRAVSPAVIHGMLGGIGILIVASQFHVMIDSKPLGSGLDNLLGIPSTFVNAIAMGGKGLEAFNIGLLTIAVMMAWSGLAPRKLQVIPAPLVAVIGAVVAAALHQLPIHYVSVPDNIWSAASLPTHDVLTRLFDSHMLKEVLVAALSIAFIASVETLLSATAVDQMHQGPRTKYNKELFAQGVGNSICGLLGALPLTGVIVRSSANVAAGARTRASAIIHGIWLLVFISALPFVLELVPIASLAAVLVYTSYKLVYPKALPELLNYGKSEVAIYLVTIAMIVYSNLLEGVLVGLGLSILKLLYAFSHLEIRSEDDPGENRVNLHLKGAATLIRLPKLAAALEQIRPDADIHVHFEELDYIDHACLDLLHNWERQHKALGGSLVIEWEALSGRYHRRHASKQARREAARSWSHRPSRKVVAITERTRAIG